MFNPTILLWALVLYTTYFVSRSIQTHLRRKEQAAKWRCRPVRKAPSSFFGLGRFRAVSEAAKNQMVFPWYKKQHEQYGTTYEYSILGSPQISTIEPENIKTILATSFSDYSMGLRSNQFRPLLGDGIFTQDGADWSHSRALLRPQFSREQVINMESMINLSKMTLLTG
jgi:cytochrome P450